MRGLKHFSLDRKHHGHEVASFTDAWIETVCLGYARLMLGVASFTDAWIETIVPKRAVPPLVSHLLQMRGLKL